jgi:lysophospholipase L1-like esterase
VPSAVTAAPFVFAVEGDSLSTVYTGARASDGDKSWVQLLELLRPGAVDIHDVAGNGNTSSDVASIQSAKVASLVKQGAVHFALLEIGGNDEKAFLPQIVAGNFQPFVSTVVQNIESALTTVQNAGQVQQVLSLLPDIGITPDIQAKLNHDPVSLGRITTAVSIANQQLEAFAQAHRIGVVDSFALGQLSKQPSISLAGTQTNDYSSPDGFHPSSVMPGLFANSAMRAFQTAFGVNTSGLQLSDQEILQSAGDGAQPSIQTPTFFNVQPFVIAPSSTPASATSGAASSVKDVGTPTTLSMSATSQPPSLANAPTNLAGSPAVSHAAMVIHAAAVDAFFGALAG